MHSILGLSLAQTHIFHLTERHALDAITHNIQPEHRSRQCRQSAHICGPLPPSSSTSSSRPSRRAGLSQSVRRARQVSTKYFVVVPVPSTSISTVWTSLSVGTLQATSFLFDQTNNQKRKKFLYTTKFHCIAVHSHSCLL